MGMIELRWAVPENTTTDQKVLQFRQVREWPSPPGTWRNVPTEATSDVLKDASPKSVRHVSRSSSEDSVARDLHAAMCQAVSILNTCPYLGAVSEVYKAHQILRQALIDFAAAARQSDLKT